MSFRVEEKFRISKNKLLLFKKWLNANNAEKIFPDRKIISIYLDNEEKKLELELMTIKTFCMKIQFIKKN